MPPPDADNPYSRRCSFCHAPPGIPCRTVRYEEHLEYGGGYVHEQPHASRMVKPVSPS